MVDLQLTDEERQRIYMLRQRLVLELLPLVKKVEAISQELLAIMTSARQRGKSTLN